MTALSEFYPLVLPEVVGCSKPVALNAIRFAVEQFHVRTLCKRENLAGIITVADTTEYALVLPADYVLHKMLHVHLDDEEITAIGMDDRDGIDPYWKTTTAQPVFYYLPNTENIGLFLTPDGTYNVSCEAALKPSTTATTIDDWLFEQYRETIAAGAKYRLMGMLNQPWANAERAMVYVQEFNNGIGKAGFANNRGHGRAQKRTRSVFGLR